ncbi:MAG: tRNA (N(6)-L-threonylcarbamoyladenosine(37)-C(2))-methylthiotransferase MtaB [Armatimonadota bacterium]|nr:tRNA (N(6)-L-threonylcarbamoyladenosine(37)-C(2))-methylthiotransferase MtaB [bacterium]
MLTIAYHTLGCKVNQYETEKMREALETAGFRTVPFSGCADAYIINTCSVTSVADGKSRAAIRRALRLNPDAFVVVAGCYAALEPAQVQAIEGVDLVVPHGEKELIPERIRAHFGASTPTDPHPTTPKPRMRTRAVVKVQDGCDQFCAYCVIPYARTGRTSRPMASIMDELRALAGFGYREIVLAGIRLGSYDADEIRLPELISCAAEIDGIERIRLSSIEPWEVDDALLDAMSSPKVCRHLHIPLQSGDDAVLGRMGRPYRSEEYRTIISKVRDRIEGVGITTDVIVGFPGETDEEFENTCNLIRSVDFSRLHVFRYSPRPRTRAASMPDQVEAGVKKLRADKLIDLGKLATTRFASSQVGKELSVLVESEVSGQGCPETIGIATNKHFTGFGDNYVEVVLPGDSSLKKNIVKVLITGVDQDGRALGTLT